MNSKSKTVMSLVFLIVLLGIMIFSNLNMVLSSTNSMQNTQATTVSQTTYMYLTMKGAKQGDIKGSVTEAGHEGQILVLSYTHSIVSPTDPASGLPTGKRQHKPITITKQLDKSTPLLYNSLVTNENIVSWKLWIYTSQSDGTRKLTFTIELTNGHIADFTTRGSNYGTTETISFTYQKITWTWVDGGIVASDDWESPIAS